MIKKRYSKWRKVLAAGLVCSMLIPAVLCAAAETTQNVAVETAAQESTAVPTPDPVESNAYPNWPQAADISSGTACLMDADTGVILYNKKMQEKMYPASTTKVMTALIALENASLDEIVTFTQTGVAEAYSGSSNLNTKVGEQFTMEDCLYALMLKSANDFASQIAEHVGGSVEAFCQMMNDKAASLGCVNTHFNNAHGMPDENHYTCAYDLALIMRAAIKNETFCKIAAAESYVIPATTQSGARTVTNHNALIVPGEYKFEGCIAGKTGYTDAAQSTFVSAARRNDVTLIECTMFSPSSVDSFVNGAALYEYGFNNFTNHVVEEGNHVYSGGKITLPNGVALSAYDTQNGETFNTAFGNMVWRYYYKDGYKIGEVAVTEEVVLEEQRIIDEANAKMEAERLAEQERLERLKEELLSEPMLEPISNDLFTPSHIIIGVFIILIGIGIVAILVTIIVKSIRKSKKKKARKRREMDAKRLKEQIEEVSTEEVLWDLQGEQTDLPDKDTEESEEI